MISTPKMEMPISMSQWYCSKLIFNKNRETHLMTRLDELPSLLTSHTPISDGNTTTFVEDFTQIMDLRKNTVNQDISQFTEMESDDVEFGQQGSFMTGWRNFTRH